MVVMMVWVVGLVVEGFVMTGTVVAVNTKKTTETMIMVKKK